MSTPFMEVNLLPRESVQERYSFGLNAVAIGTLSVVTVAFCIVGWMQRDGSQREELLLSQATLAAGDVQKKLNALQAKLGGPHTNSSVTQMASAQIMVQPFVNSISNILPVGVTLTTIQVTGDQLNLTGNCNSMASLASYEDALQKLSNVDHVFVQSVSAAPQGGLTFTINAVVSGSGKS